MVEKVKEIRVSIDGLIPVVKDGLEKWCSETEHAIKSLSLAKMWLGKALGELGESNPYPESSNPQSDKIEPSADVAEQKLVFDDIDMTNTVALAKKVRSEIKRLENDLCSYFSANITATDLGVFVNQSRLSLIEANMWIGMKLSDFRNRKEDQEITSKNIAQQKYEVYVEAIKSREAPGNVYVPWNDLSPMQQEAWVAVGMDQDNEIMGTQRG